MKIEKIIITMKNGNKIHAELYPEIAPETVKNFLYYIDSGFYSDTIFHRIIKGFMSQCGGYYINDKQLLEKENKNSPIIGEFSSNGITNNLNHQFGVLSMARTPDPNSATTQFFICDDNCAFLNGEYAAFGMVVGDDSLRIIKEINNYPTFALAEGFEDFTNAHLEDITIESISREI